MARTDPAINLRIPAELKARIEEAARLAGRSTNAEIVKRLAESLLDLDLDAEKGYSPEQLRGIVDGIDRRMHEVKQYRDMLAHLVDADGRVAKAMGAPDGSAEEILTGRKKKPKP